MTVIAILVGSFCGALLGGLIYRLLLNRDRNKRETTSPATPTERIMLMHKWHPEVGLFSQARVKKSELLDFWLENPEYNPCLFRIEETKELEELGVFKMIEKIRKAKREKQDSKRVGRFAKRARGGKGK